MSRVPRMDDAEARAWLALIGTAELLPTALDAQLQAEADLTHYEFIVLSALRRAAESGLRLTDLAAATNAALPRASKVATRLAARGLVTRTAAADDRRGVDVALTSAGRRALVHATPGHIALVRDLVIDRLTPEQLGALADALEPVVAALDPQQRMGMLLRDDTAD